MRRKIAVVTGSRAEYGLLYWLLKALDKDPAIQLQLFVTGMHLSHEFGLTCREIENDGFVIDEKVEMLLSSDTASAITKSIGLGTIGFADAFERAKPDMVVILGDRFEIFAAAQAALIAKIPTAHIHGGELTEGAFDDALRHSMTKMSHLHFVSHNIYRDRVIQLGEQPDNVITVGPLVTESLARMDYLSSSEMADIIGLPLSSPVFAITYHPETLSGLTVQDQFGQLLSALDKFDKATLVFTKANADTAGRVINEMIDSYCEHHPHRARGMVSLGHQKYLSLLALSDVVIGNSSSAIIEAPYFNIPTVNIGDRQKGRVHASSIINCTADTLSIMSAIEKALDSAKLRSNAKSQQSQTSPKAHISEIIVEKIKSIPLEGLVKKAFWDL